MDYYLSILPQELFDIIIIKLVKTLEIFTLIYSLKLDENHAFRLLCIQLNNYFKKFPVNVIYRNYIFSWRSIYNECYGSVRDIDETFYLYVYDYHVNDNKDILPIISKILQENYTFYAETKWYFFNDLISKLRKDIMPSFTIFPYGASQTITMNIPINNNQMIDGYTIGTSTGTSTGVSYPVNHFRF